MPENSEHGNLLGRRIPKFFNARVDRAWILKSATRFVIPVPRVAKRSLSDESIKSAIFCFHVSAERGFASAFDSVFIKISKYPLALFRVNGLLKKFTWH